MADVARRIRQGLILSLGMASLFSSQAVAAREVTFVCQIDQKSLNDGWLPATVEVTYSTEGTRAIVKDALISRFVGKPMLAEIETENAKRVTFIWQMLTTGKDGAKQTYYRLSVFKAKQQASMAASIPRAWPPGEYQANGTCKQSGG